MNKIAAKHVFTGLTRISLVRRTVCLTLNRESRRNNRTIEQHDYVKHVFWWLWLRGIIKADEIKEEWNARIDHWRMYQLGTRNCSIVGLAMRSEIRPRDGDGSITRERRLSA